MNEVNDLCWFRRHVGKEVPTKWENSLSLTY